MKKFGFTLAEILITLGIIGVVAALTTPALVKNSGKAKIGPTLAKFVNTFETGVEQLFYNESVNLLTGVAPCNEDDVDLCMDQNILDILSKYIIMSPLSEEDTEAYCIYSEKEANTENSMLCGSDVGTRIMQLKDGSIIGILNYLGNTYSPKGPFKGDIGEIFFDINGVKGNNRAGKEVFSFLIDNSGVLVPNGSSMHIYLKSNAVTYEPASDDVFKSLALTGKIADNNYKAE